MTKWTKSPTDIVEMAVPWFTERNHHYDRHSARLLAEQFYTGYDLNYATRKLHKLLEPAIGQVKYQQQLARHKSFVEMEQTLNEEGWTYCPDPTGLQAGLYWHESGISVNRQGGFWDSYEEATLKTFNSATRALLLQKEQPSEVHKTPDGLSV
jgi:hypothetical protein